jgi:formate dehydrogenase iron-sulfur subunit
MTDGTASREPFGLLVDLRRCSGCRRCVVACLEAHGAAGDRKDLRAAAKRTTDLDPGNFTTVVKRGGTWVRNMCRHCVSPSCASACPVGALRKSPLGPVTYDEGRCIGCRYCLLACPFNVPRYEWGSANPRLRKCDMCAERVEKGGMPACAAACPEGATLFGPRSELLAEARARIERAPEAYHDRIYGEKEAGGTSVLFLAPFPLEELGYKAALGESPLPAMTEAALKRVPAIAVCGGAVLVALWWVLRRRDEVAEAKAAATRAACGRIRGVPGTGGEVDRDVRR